MANRIYIYTYTHIHIHIYTYTHTHIHTYTYTHIHIYTYDSNTSTLSTSCAPETSLLNIPQQFDVSINICKIFTQPLVISNDKNVLLSCRVSYVDPV